MSREPAYAGRRRTGMRVAVAAAVLALVTGGCGSATKPESERPAALAGTAPATAAAKSAAPAPPVTVTVGLQEREVRLAVGQQLVVRPAPGRAGKASVAVDPPGGRVLRPAGGNAASGWGFTATGRGTARVLVTYGPHCVPGELCPVYRGMLSRLTVTVVG